MCRCLVRWEGFDATHDSWILRENVTLEAIIAYEEHLTDMASLGGKSEQDKLDSFVGFQGQFSALAPRTRQRDQQLHRAQRAVALEASAHQNAEISEVPDVSAHSGRRRTKVNFFKPT